jgi:prepilin-type N-terminal cleavage/methylation domain-containing protein
MTPNGEIIAEGRPMRPRRVHRSRRGFTLVEVLATLMLAAIVMPAAMQGISLALGASSYAKRSLEAAQLAETKLNEMVAMGTIQGGTTSGDFGDDWPDYKWTATVQQLDLNMNQIDVEVSYPYRNDQRTVKLSTLVYTNQTGSSSLGLP